MSEHKTDIGNLVKKRRKEQKITLKELSDRTKLSIGFLSQFERGMTSIALDSLQKIAKELDMDMNAFFHIPKKSAQEEDPVVRSYNREIGLINSKFVQFHLAKNISEAHFLPRLYELWPSSGDQHVKTYMHEGAEFIYVLEGILTLNYKNKVYELYPEDCAYLDSAVPHNWENNTNKKVRLLVVNAPNPLVESSENPIDDEH